MTIKKNGVNVRGGKHSGRYCWADYNGIFNENTEPVLPHACTANLSVCGGGKSETLATQTNRRESLSKPLILNVTVDSN